MSVSITNHKNGPEVLRGAPLVASFRNCTHRTDQSEKSVFLLPYQLKTNNVNRDGLHRAKLRLCLPAHIKAPNTAEDSAVNLANTCCPSRIQLPSPRLPASHSGNTPSRYLNPTPVSSLWRLKDTQSCTRVCIKKVPLIKTNITSYYH